MERQCDEQKLMQKCYRVSSQLVKLKMPLTETQPPQLEWGNLIVAIDESLKDLEDNKYNVIGRVSMRRGDSMLCWNQCGEYQGSELH